MKIEKEKKLLENAKIARGISFDKASRVVLCGGLALNREKNVWQLIHNNVNRSQFFNLLNKDEIARSTISDPTLISANFQRAQSEIGRAIVRLRFAIVLIY